MATELYKLPRLLLLESDLSTNSIFINRTIPTTNSSPNSKDNSFDGNMVIILAALLCALICVLGLHSIMRCALRCTQVMGRNVVNGDVANFASSGIKKGVLSQIPAVVYNSGVHIPATDCPICLTEFAEGDDVRILPVCSHGFHVKCIDKWLVLHSSCPTCRQPFVGNCVSSYPIAEPVILQSV